MKVEILNLQNLFQKQVRYEIPEFQRRYIWNQEDQWELLWQDVQAMAETILEGASGNSPGVTGISHFMGAVVLQESSTVTSDGLDRRIVVDGQQRLTTLQLLLDAIREQLAEVSQSQASARLSSLVLNQEAFLGDDPDNAFKIWPTTGDQAEFRQAMRNDLDSNRLPDSLIIQCHRFFALQVKQWLEANPQQTEARARAIEETIARKLELAVLDLAKEDDPHIIFETLNARGTPLLESDLIKNMVLYEAGKDGISENASSLWPFDDRWWTENVRQARLLRPRIEVFLNYWLVIRLLKTVNANRVFYEFRGYFHRPENGGVREIARDIRQTGQFYRDLEENASYLEMDPFHYRWKVMELGVLTPILLWLQQNKVPASQMSKALTALESYSVRRMLCRLSFTNRIFLELLAKLGREDPEQAGDSITEFLGNLSSSTWIWPDDQQVEQVFLGSPLYTLLTRGRVRMVLEAIESALRTEKAETQNVPSNLTIEHIMPQQWHPNWPLPENVANRTTASNERRRIIHSMGNLTLVNNRLNADLSNAPWEQKQQTLGEHSVLFLNKTLLSDAPAIWDETAIADRAKRLFQVAIRIWPHADQLKARNG